MICQMDRFGQKGFVPLVNVEMNVMGIQRTMNFDIDEYIYQMALKRGFIEVLREEHYELTKVPELENAMKNAQYFTMSALVKVYPILEYLAKYDAEMQIGKRCASVGTVKCPVHIVKVGEAVYENDGSVQKMGLYRVSSVILPNEADG